MNGIIYKVLFTPTLRALSITTRKIQTKEYLGLTFLQGKEKEAHAKVGRNAIKTKENFMKYRKRRGMKDLRRNEIMNFMHLVDGEKDMANLSIVMEDL